MNEREVAWRKEGRHNLRKSEATWIRSKSDKVGRRSWDAWDVRDRFVAGSDVESWRGSDHDEMDRSSEVGR